jgi:predicted transposase YdaD
MTDKTSLDIQRLSHDKVFKQAMQHLEVARDFFASHLPMFIKQRVDLNTLKHCSTEYAHQHAVKLKASAVDLLFSVEVIGQNQHRTDGFNCIVRHNRNHNF